MIRKAPLVLAPLAVLLVFGWAAKIAELSPHQLPDPTGWTPRQLATIEPPTVNDRTGIVNGNRPIDDYLCEVYQRTPIKKDGAGDFTWKDAAAARRRGLDVCSYAIGGLSPELKERLHAFGMAADARGIEWSMLSGFRDDWRQSVASGLKARTGNSMHGGSRVTKGYGDGRAVDIDVAKGSIMALFKLVDSVGRTLGLVRPYPGFDPNHVQLANAQKVKHANHRATKRVQTAETSKRKARHTRTARRHKLHPPSKGWTDQSPASRA